MNIGIDVRCLMRGRYSGIAEYTYQLLTALFAQDQVNHYWLFYNSFKPVNLPHFSGPNVHYVGFRYSNQLLILGLKFFGWPKIDRLIAKKYLLYTQPIKFDLWFLPNMGFISFSPEVSTILTMHDLSHEIFPEFLSAKAKMWHYLVKPQKLCQRARAVIAVSANTKHDLVNLYHVPAEKIITIPSGLSMDFGVITDQEKLLSFKQKYHLPDKFILGLGTIEPRKNWESLILAWQRAKIKYNLPHQLVLAGGRGWLNQKVFSLIKQSRFRQDIRYLGAIKPEQRPALYNLASLFVYPSWYEGFGFPPLEAMACGVPTIVANNSSLPEVVGEAALLVNADNVIEISEAINAVLSSQTVSDELRFKGLVRAKQFSWQTAAQKTLAVFSALKKNPQL